ncbi:hypothetical protein [Gordonia rhizosphera]|uniref:Uncharacterized protein n=1 Tax=Gordonia rhizosphera NBRC 16068 TaxID=1108045 RepID=K6VRI0_9ACTN|nr:hypothetical protein [Gordonia rhizosphera]GAB89530.1 hypothetical protein GORHZ_064_00170 [Gordonia rhizosphera NBRC 16068]
MGDAATIESTGVLARMAEAGRLGDLVAPTSAARADLEAAGRRYARPLHVEICGRPGTGRDTLARAMRERLAVSAIGPGESTGPAADADLWIHLLGGPPRRADHDLLSSLPADRTIVVLGKADTHGEPSVAAAVAADCARSLGVEVPAVSPLLACSDLADEEFVYLRRLAAAGAKMPPMTGRFLTGTLAEGPDRPGSEPSGGDERALRTGLLRRIDRFGIATALRLIAAGGPAGGSAGALNRALHELSRLDRLVPPIRGRVERVRFWRLAELRAALELTAARGHDRETIEHLLRAGGV